MDTKTLFENKKEYLQYIQDLLTEPFIHEFQMMYDATLSRTASGKVLKEFQSSVSEMNQWNHVMIASMRERVVEQCKCEFLPDLIRAIFVTYVRFHLASHGKLDNIKKIKIRVPNEENFLHKCMISCARVVWKQPYLFYHAVRTIERQHNRVQVEDAFRKAIASTIRNAIPWSQILNVTITDDGEEIGTSETDEETATDTSSESSSEEQNQGPFESHEASEAPTDDENESNEEDEEDEDEDGEEALSVVEVETVHETPNSIQEVTKNYHEEEDDEEPTHLTEDDVIDALAETSEKMITIHEEDEDDEEANTECGDELGNDQIQIIDRRSESVTNNQHDVEEHPFASANKEEDQNTETERTVTISTRSPLPPKKIHKPKLTPRPRITDAFF